MLIVLVLYTNKHSELLRPIRLSRGQVSVADLAQLVALTESVVVVVPYWLL